VKKTLILALVVSFVLSVAGTAFAFPVDFSGDFKYEFRQNSDFGKAKYQENRFYTELKFSGKIDDSTSFFSRFGGQVKDNQSKPGNGDYATTSGFTMDQFGVKAKAGDWNFAIGRQGTQLGQGGIFYAGNDVDPLTYFDGVVATTKMGDFNVSVIGGKAVSSNLLVQTTNLMGIYPDQSWVGVDFKVPVDKVTVGFAYAKSSVYPNALVLGTVPLKDAKYWDLNFATKIGNSFDFSGEYVKSDASTANAAFTFAGTYTFDPDNNFTVAYNNVQGNSTDPVNSNIGTLYYPNGSAFSLPGTSFGYKGFTYAYHHQITKAMGFNAYYLTLQPLLGTTAGHTNDELGLNVKWSF